MEKNKALVIDDEQIVLDSVNKILKDENYEVDVSLSGREGLDQAIKKPHARHWRHEGPQRCKEGKVIPSCCYHYRLCLSKISSTGHEAWCSRLYRKAIYP